MAQRVLIRHAKDAEDVASGLHIFRERVPRSATRITAIISELFALSSLLREIDQAQGDRQYASFFHRIQDDLDLVLPTLQRTLDATFDMFARSQGRLHQTVWADLGYKMEREEGLGLLERLQLYREFLQAQFDVLTGYEVQDLRLLRRQLVKLLDAQDVSAMQGQRQTIDASGMLCDSATSTSKLRVETD